MIIAVDMDSTMTKDEWPEIGANVPWAFEVVRELIKNGHKIILLTQREHEAVEGCDDVLEAALKRLKEEKIEVYSINSFPERDNLYYPSRKVYADVYVDDHNIGIKLCPYTNKKGEYSPYVDCAELDKWFVRKGFYKNSVCQK